MAIRDMLAERIEKVCKDGDYDPAVDNYAIADRLMPFLSAWMRAELSWQRYSIVDAINKATRKLDVRAAAEELGIEIDDEAGREQLDILTGRRFGPEGGDDAG